jgi:hypothetical protein
MIELPKDFDRIYLKAKWKARCDKKVIWWISV